MSSRTILLIEDNEDDIFFMRRALEKAGIECNLQVTEDGEQAIDYLSAAGEFRDRSSFPLPSLILLDLKIPKKNGFEVLEWIRNRPESAGLVIIVLSSSRHARDVAMAARLGANSFLVKPPNIDELSDAMRAVKTYWWDNDQIVAEAPSTPD